MELIINLVVLLILMALGLFVGRYQERKHFAHIELRERQMADMLVTQLGSFPYAQSSFTPPSLMVAEVVIATDYLKNFLANIRKFFGGRVRSYQSLLTRARREAVLRMMEQARDQGYNALCNVRLETADVGGNSQMRRVAMVAILASATAYHASSSATGKTKQNGKQMT